jgi:regulatory protein
VGRLIALRLLEAKPRTERELHDALCGRGIPPDVAGQLVARFVEVGLLDDRVYARMWVESRMRSRGLGIASLRRELRARGLPDDVIAEALADVDATDSHHAGVQAVRGRVARCELPLTGKDERRLLGFLMRRGHGYEAARTILAEAVRVVSDVQAGTPRTYSG